MRYSTNKKLAFLIQVFYLAVWVLLAYLAWKAAGLIWPFLAALVLVGCIHPLVRFLHRKMKLNQKVLSVTFLALLYGGVGFGLFFLCTRLVFWLQGLFTQLPDYYNSTIQPLLENFSLWAENWLAGLPVEITSMESLILESPSFITAPWPYSFSICFMAASKAFCLSSLVTSFVISLLTGIKTSFVDIS